MGSQLECVRRENSHRKEPQKYKTTDRRVLHMRIHCGKTHTHRDYKSWLSIWLLLVVNQHSLTGMHAEILVSVRYTKTLNIPEQNKCVDPAQANESESVSMCMRCFTWKAFRCELSEWPEDITHERRTTGAGLCYRRKNLMHITLKILLRIHKHMQVRSEKILRANFSVMGIYCIQPVKLHQY